MEQLIGYSLIDSANNEIRYWGDWANQIAGVPIQIVLPNNDIISYPIVDTTYGDYRFVHRWIVANPPSKWHEGTGFIISFDGTRIIKTITYPVDPNLLPEYITRRQLLLGLVLKGVITAAEALSAAKTGVVPASLQTAIDAITDTNLKFDCNISWSTRQNFTRLDPIILLLQQVYSRTDAQVDDLFRAASDL